MLCIVLPFLETASAVGQNVSLSRVDDTPVPVSDSIRECGCQKRVVTRTALKPSLAITWFIKGRGPSSLQDDGWMKVCCPGSLFPPPLLQLQETQEREGFCTGLSCLVSVPTSSLSQLCCTSPELVKAEPACFSWLQKWRLLVCSFCLQAKWDTLRFGMSREDANSQELSESYFSFTVWSALHLSQCPINCSVTPRSLFSTI